MFTEKIITKTGYLETCLPFREFYELVETINTTNLSNNFNYGLAGQIENEKELNLNFFSDAIKKTIIKGCHRYIEIFGHNKFLYNEKLKYNLKFEKTWINFQKKYEYNPVHSHSGDLVFVIWIQIPYDLNDEHNHKSSINSNHKIASQFQFTNVLPLFSNHCNEIIPVDKSYEGKMIIFHANMQHTVYPFFTSDDYRISMSGNLSIVFENE